MISRHNLLFLSDRLSELTGLVEQQAVRMRHHADQLSLYLQLEQTGSAYSVADEMFDEFCTEGQVDGLASAINQVVTGIYAYLSTEPEVQAAFSAAQYRSSPPH